jgi:hypothetical protein
MERAKIKTETLLDEIGITTGDRNRNRIMERFALLNQKDVHLLQTIVAQINKKLK